MQSRALWPMPCKPQERIAVLRSDEATEREGPRLEEVEARAASYAEREWSRNLHARLIMSTTIEGGPSLSR